MYVAFRIDENSSIISSIGMNVLYQDLTQKEMEKSYYLTKEMETSMALLSRSNEMV